MRIKIEGYGYVPPELSPHKQLLHANLHLRDKAKDMSCVNLGRLSKIHWKKIEQWMDNRRVLMTDELRRVGRVLDIKIKIDE
jgi:hypothetical protein